MKKKVLVICGAILGILIAISASMCVVLCFKTLHKMDTQNETLKKDFTTQLNALKKELTKDDADGDKEPQYVTIAGMYKIEDTSKISDAYLKKDTSALSATEKETLQIAAEVLNKITTDKMNLYEKEVAIHDWMVKNIQYDNGSLIAVPNNENGLNTPHGVLRKKKAVCVGYATTFKLFMNMLGADCMVVHSTDLSHSWDQVKLDDGKWYLTDITFDAGNTFVSYANFNCSEDTFIQNHTWSTDLYPKAEGVKYNYCVQQAKAVKDVKKLPSMIKKAMDKKKTNLFYLLPKNVDENYVQTIGDGISQRITDTMDYSVNYTVNEEDQIVMAISIFYKENAADDDELAQLNNTLDELFGPSQY